MATINLRDYYPFYQYDLFVEVPDDLVDKLDQWDRDEEAYYKRRSRNKAYYSLDCGDGIEQSILFVADSPDEYYVKKLTCEQLHAALSMLPDKQAKRIYAHCILGLSKAQIARAEGVSTTMVAKSIIRGLQRLKKIFTGFL